MVNTTGNKINSLQESVRVVETRILGYVPTADEVNERNQRGIGLMDNEMHICVEAKARRLNIYGECPVCEGRGDYYAEERYRDLAENWEMIDPPKGPGWQMWENTSEGSPISPVFKCHKELARWLADNKASAFGAQTATYEEWLSMIERGWAPSLVVQGGEVKSGVEASFQNPVNK